jgi:hypothetical protein
MSQSEDGSGLDVGSAQQLVASVENQDEAEQVLNKEARAAATGNFLDADAQRQSLDLREKFSGRFFWLVTAYLCTVVVMLFLSGLNCVDFVLSDTVLVTLLGTTTLTVVSLLYIVARHIFPENKR